MKELGRGFGGVSDSVGVYISVPFCRAKCTYCNFASGVFGAERMDAYVDRVCGEVAHVRRAALGMGAELPQRVDTIFLGGGTPSLLSAEQMGRLFGAVRGEFEVVRGAEVTLECAPGQVGEETLDAMLRLGMNRVSFGVQSFVDAEARAVGRLHTREMCLAEIGRMRAAGLRELNVDLIVGLPGQTAESWRESVEVAIGSGVPHVSVYMLEVDEDSRLGREMLSAGEKYGAGRVPGEDEIAEWYGGACGWLEGAGIRQYEISNFAREGSASRHNVKYWRREGYVGFGLDAHSMLRDGSGAVRWANGDDLDRYLGGDEIRRFRPASGMTILNGGDVSGVAASEDGGPQMRRVGREEGFEEAMFLGLRMSEGVDLEVLRGEFGGLVDGVGEALGDAVDAGLVVMEGGRVRLTGAGRMASNEVFSRLLS
ncbi:MAG TPA: radical SAM family heme chaperone HemW [Acidobacteriaceae bacterium]|nr:radical SAM family heme chaperone HemW [Acidobacteriaceae bacterium]